MNGLLQSTIGRTRIPRCCQSVISARKPRSGPRSHPFLKRRPQCDPGKKVESRVPPQIVESENISDTGSEFITTTNCRPFRLSPRGFYSFFLRRKPARYNEVMADRPPNDEAPLMTKFSSSVGYGAPGE